MVHENFKHALARRYGAIKAQYPAEGRRKWRLRALYDSWATIGAPTPSPSDSGADNSFETDADPLDEFLEDDEIGIVIRTDCSNDAAWGAFVQKFEAAQKELLSDLTGGDSTEEAEPEGDADVAMADDAQPTAGSSAAAPEGDQSDDDSGDAPDIMKILDPSDNPADKARLANISNLTALRLFNDVDIRPAPPRPTGTKQIAPQNPLIDQGGWQEIYTGKNIWIYDERSNTDECLRVVSQQGDFYGTATGDSWRARASHVCELQFSMAYQGMKIDFNGLDKWDWNERVRNLAEAGRF